MSHLLVLQPPTGWHEQKLTRQQQGKVPTARVFYRSAEEGVRLWVLVEQVPAPPQGWHLAVSTLRNLLNPHGGGYLHADRRPTLEEVEEACEAFLPADVAVGVFWPPRQERAGSEHPTTWHVRQALYGVPLPPMRRAAWSEAGVLLMAGVGGDGK